MALKRRPMNFSRHFHEGIPHELAFTSRGMKIGL
jgi:hypothetical protein